MIVCRLPDILRTKGMSRRELARRAGVNKNTICKWAQGEVVMLDLATLDLVCAALQVQPGELLVWREETTDHAR